MATRERFEVLVVGAGPAGMAAACAASAAAEVGVVDDNPSPGGQVWRSGKISVGDRLAGKWLRKFANAKVARIHATQIVAAPERGLLMAERDGRPIELRYDKLVLATGARERFLAFPGWMLPNVVGAGGLQAMLKAGLSVEGKRVVLAGSGPLLLSVAAYARQAGAIVPLLAEQAAWPRVAAFGMQLLWLSPDKLWQGMGYRWSLRNTRLFDRLLADSRARQREDRGRDASVRRPDLDRTMRPARLRLRPRAQFGIADVARLRNSRWRRCGQCVAGKQRSRQFIARAKSRAWAARSWP